MKVELESGQVAANWYFHLWELHPFLMAVCHLVIWILVGLHWYGLGRIVFNNPVQKLEPEKRSKQQIEDDKAREALATILIIIIWPLTALAIFAGTIISAYEKGATPDSPIICSSVHFILYWIGRIIAKVSIFLWRMTTAPFRYLFWVTMGYGRVTTATSRPPATPEPITSEKVA